MGIADRIEGTIENWSGKWGSRLAGWFGSWTSGAAVKVLELLEPEAVANVDEILAEVEKNQAIPAPIRGMITRARGARQPVHFLVVAAAAIIILIPMILGLFQPLQRILNYAQERLFHSGRMDWMTAIDAWRRGFITETRLNQTLEDHGFDDQDTATLKNVSLFFPSAQDLITWQAREVFEPAMIAKYGLMDEFETLNLELFHKAGISDEQSGNYWMAHWEHAAFNQVVEMLRRGLVEIEDVWEWFRLVEIPPYWRDKLIGIMWNVPTRVDVRRFWDMRTIDETRLREIYTAQGYHGKDLDDYVLWTKVYVAFPDLVARWKNGWITMDDIRSELTALGMPPDRVNELIQTKIQADEPERIKSERDLTKTDIYKGVKQNRITRAQAVELLQELGFSADEADYLLDINIPVDDQDDQVEYKKLTKSDIKAAVRELLIPASVARERLLELRYSPSDADLLVKIYTAGIPEEVVEEQRELTKSDIGRALKAGIMTEQEARGYLLSLRYSPQDVDTLIELNTPPAELVEAEEARQLSKSDIRTALRAFVMSPEEAIVRLEGIGYTTEDAGFLVYLWTTIEDLKMVAVPREQSKADVVLAVKKGLLSPEEAYIMLQDLGFSPEAAEFILTVRAESSPFSPVSYGEFKDLTAKYRRIAGMTTKDLPEEIRELADQFVKTQLEVDSLERAEREERRRLNATEEVPDSASAELKRIQVAKNRAIAELERIQLDYNAKVSQWRRTRE